MKKTNAEEDRMECGAAQQNSAAGADTSHSGPINCLVRIGCHGHVGLFRVVDPTQQLQRGERVVCRTARGLEVGEVLRLASDLRAVTRVDGQLLRKVDEADRLLWQELQRLAALAYDECQQWLRDHQVDAILLDVEPLLDGRTLYFHFLTAVPDLVQQHLTALADIYESRVEESGLRQKLEVGCGPDCGTERAQGGCGSGGACSVCVKASRCSASGSALREGAV